MKITSLLFFGLTSIAHAGLPDTDPVTAHLRNLFANGHSPSTQELVRDNGWNNCLQHSSSSRDFYSGPSIYDLSVNFTPIDGMFRLQGSSFDATLAPTPTDGIAGVMDGLLGPNYFEAAKISEAGDLILELDTPKSGSTDDTNFPVSLVQNGSLLNFSYVICPKTTN